MNRRWLRVLLGLIALVMLADFVFRGILPALGPGKNDFSEVYVGGWLWRHGQNFYDAGLATATGDQLANTRVNIVLIYPPTALVLIAPFTFLPLPWANFLWLILGLAGIAVTIAVLIRMAGLRTWDDRALILGTFVLSFDPLHQAFHLGNVALVAVPLCFLGVYCAENDHDFSAGILLSLAAALKPQLGFWFLAFYLLQFRKQVFKGAMLPAVGLALGMVRYPTSAGALISSYLSNLQYWFGQGRLYGFTEGALPFHVNNIQVIVYQLVHRAELANVLAYGLFVCGLVVWGVAINRTRFQMSVPLAISSLAGLSFISLYHSVSDVTVLTLALCWAFGKTDGPDGWKKRTTCGLFLLAMLPGHSALMRMTPYLASWITNSWVWNFFVARYFIWLLLSLNAVLLYSLAVQTRQRGSRQIVTQPTSAA
jgi:hypothetical protein